MTSDELYQMMRKTQEPKGYYFNRFTEHTFRLLDSLLINKDRYGYMSCPCRLASNDRDWDKDIICPCSYREPDVKDFGKCFCGLYVSKAWNDGKIEDQYVPERRPEEKLWGKF
ncbi:MAG: ferredoxin:thioredoxin reductase [Candidatus Marinimicrobia bacterium]|nr:ferredoxin:thioredoxin reductase [Candidatus Neomarinimicrobiota bacterium]